MSRHKPTFEEFVRPVIATADPQICETTPLSRLVAGDYAVLAWFDEVAVGLHAGAEADLVARWDTATLRDVYELVYAPAPGATFS